MNKMSPKLVRLDYFFSEIQPFERGGSKIELEILLGPFSFEMCSGGRTCSNNFKIQH